MSYPSERYEQYQQIIDSADSSEDEREIALCRMAFWQARFKENKWDNVLADLFLALWYNQVLTVINSNLFINKGRVRRDIEKFYKRPELTAAMATAGARADELLQTELTDSAVRYLEFCREDKRFGSILFSLVKLKDSEVASKAAKEAVECLLLPLIQIDRPLLADPMIKAIHAAYPIAFPAYANYLEINIDMLGSQNAAKIRAVINP